MKKLTAKNFAAVGFVGAILAVTVAGAAQTVLMPDELAAGENRYANKLELPTLDGYLDGSFQDGVEAALGDQVTLSATLKNVYQKFNSYSIKLLINPFLNSQAAENKYTNLGSSFIFGGKNLVLSPWDKSRAAEFDDRIENYNELMPKYDDVDFYVYYIERDTDINFETGEKPNLYDYLRDRLNIDDEHIDCFEVNSFEEYHENFYETDHHWNYKGSYRGYLDLVNLLGIEDEPLEPIETVHLSDSFSGSRAKNYAASYSESFDAYRFDFPEMSVTINGEAAEDYGKQEYYLSGEGSDARYGSFYGGDNGETVISTGREERENILVIGESYDNAVLKLLASHYNNLFSIDLRYYEKFMEKPFKLSEYIKEHDIDTVLLIGSNTFFSSPDFALEG